MLRLTSHKKYMLICCNIFVMVYIAEYIPITFVYVYFIDFSFLYCDEMSIRGWYLFVPELFTGNVLIPCLERSTFLKDKFWIANIKWDFWQYLFATEKFVLAINIILGRTYHRNLKLIEESFSDKRFCFSVSSNLIYVHQWGTIPLTHKLQILHTAGKSTWRIRWLFFHTMK